MTKNYQEPMLEVERFLQTDVLTASEENTPKLDDGVGDFYEQEF